MDWLGDFGKWAAGTPAREWEALLLDDLGPAAVTVLGGLESHERRVSYLPASNIQWMDTILHQSVVCPSILRLSSILIAKSVLRIHIMKDGCVFY